jgi:ribonuclease T1
MVTAAVLVAGAAGSGSVFGRASISAPLPVTGTTCPAPSDGPAGMTVLMPPRLPVEAVATLRLIAAGDPYPYARDNTIFGNYGGVLPRERYGYCRESTV